MADATEKGGAGGLGVSAGCRSTQVQGDPQDRILSTGRVRGDKRQRRQCVESSFYELIVKGKQKGMEKRKRVKEFLLFPSLPSSLPSLSISLPLFLFLSF